MFAWCTTVARWSLESWLAIGNDLCWCQDAWGWAQSGLLSLMIVPYWCSARQCSTRQCCTRAILLPAVWHVPHICTAKVNAGRCDYPTIFMFPWSTDDRLLVNYRRDLEQFQAFINSSIFNRVDPMMPAKYIQYVCRLPLPVWSKCSSVFLYKGNMLMNDRLFHKTCQR